MSKRSRSKKKIEKSNIKKLTAKPKGRVKKEKVAKLSSNIKKRLDELKRISKITCDEISTLIIPKDFFAVPKEYRKNHLNEINVTDVVAYIRSRAAYNSYLKFGYKNKEYFLIDAFLTDIRQIWARGVLDISVVDSLMTR